MRRPLGNVLLLLGTTALCLGLAEALAVFLLARPPAPYPKTRFLSSELVRNSLRQRDYEYPAAKPPGVFRIAVIGDSFSQGAGVGLDDIYAKRLERYLNQYERVEGMRYQVFNWAHAGTSTPSQAELLRRLAPGSGLDLVVLGYCLNDAEDEAHRGALQALRRRHHLGDFPEPTGFTGYLVGRSALARLVRQRILSTLRNRGFLDYYRGLYAEGYPGLAGMRAGLADLADFSRETKVPVVVMVFPLFSWELDDRYPFRDIHERLHRDLEAAGLPYLDLLPVYRGLEHRTLEAVPFKDPHPNDVAHRLAAEELYGWLKDRKLLPARGPTAPRRGRHRVPAPWSALPAPAAAQAGGSPAAGDRPGD